MIELSGPVRLAIVIAILVLTPLAMVLARTFERWSGSALAAELRDRRAFLIRKLLRVVRHRPQSPVEAERPTARPASDGSTWRSPSREH